MEKYFLLLILSTQSFAAPIDEREDFCQEPEYVVKAPLRTASGSTDELELLNEKEKENPEFAQKILASPGGYGHSELGIRYLARIFGYPAKFEGESKDRVEQWLMEQEAGKNPLYRGVFQVWDRWVRDTTHRLSVPNGALNKFPSDGNPNVFFANSLVQAKLSNCIRTDVAKLMCENSLGGRKLGRDDRVYFGKPNGNGRFCKVSIPPWKKMREASELKNQIGQGNSVNDSGSITGFGKNSAQ